ncbi:MAG TPA: tetratricopeptide repeat protein [Gemmataceae bacterium]|nr:tetratricopeptide repeat protein [Gemmataceae bacterium]
MIHLKRSRICKLLTVLIVFSGAAPLAAQNKPQPADMLLSSARRAYNEKNYSFAADRFREFLNKFGGHKEANAARYGLALCSIDGPAKDYNGAIQQLQPLVNQKDLPEHPFVLYYLGLAQRGLGTQALGQALAKPQEANQHRTTAKQRFEEASKHFASAATAFTARIPKAEAAPKKTLIELEWEARARCDQAEMLLRILKAKEARTVTEPFLQDAQLRKSRYRGLALYYHGFACFLLKDNLAAGRSLSLLTPFTDPVFGTHARYLLARVHHAAGERQEALAHYEGVLADHEKQKQSAVEALKQPDRFKNAPQEKARLEMLVRGPAPEHVTRTAFFLGVMQYEDGKFAEAIAHLNAFRQQAPTSPLAAEASLRIGFCQVQLRQLAEAQKTLQPLADKEPRLADQALLWIAKAQAGAADPANHAAYLQALKTALDTFRKAADRANQIAGSDPNAKTRRGEILLEMADTQQLAQQLKEAAATYNQILNEKLLPPREEEVMQHLATALHQAGDYNESDKVCLRFRDKHPKSVLLPAILFRHAENAYFSAVAAEKLSNPADRTREKNRWTDEAIKRYQVVIQQYPEFAHVNVARYGLGLAYYQKGDLDKAKETLEAIPAADRNGDLALVSYQLADILIRQAPADADDALAAGKLEEQLKGAIGLLEGFASSQPKSPQTADALFKLGHCQQRLASLMAQPPDQARALAAARAAYEQILQRFPTDPIQPRALFERAKVLARSKDINGAINELRRFLNDPLKNAPVAPMAVLELATLLRGQNKPQEAAKALDDCRKQHEQQLLKDPKRAAWVPLLQYHQGVALREAGKRPEAKAILDLIVRQSAGRPEAALAALRGGQCLKEEGEKKIAEAKKRLAQANLSTADLTNVQKKLDEGTKDVRDAVQYLVQQSEQLRQKQPNSEARARMLYEAAWGNRLLAEEEIEAARRKIQQDLWQKKRDEVAKKTPPGRQPSFVAAPVVPLKMVPRQPAETQARKHYQTLIQSFPDLSINADALFELAELLSERGEHDAAIKLLRDAIDKEPSAELTDKIRVRLGDCLLRKGDAKAAFAQLEPIAANVKSAQCAQAKYRAGECHLHLDAPAEAVKYLAAFRDQGPFQNLPGLTDRALLRLGYALGVLKDWNASRQAYEQVVNRFGSSPWVHEARYGIGWAYQNLNQLDNAVNAYNQVVSNLATELAARAQMNIGLCRLAQKRYAEASTALLVVPFTYDYPHLNALALVEAARAFSENKQREQAIKLLERVLRDHPDSESAKVAKKRLEELKKS